MISTASVEMFLNRKRTVKDPITGEEKEEPYSNSYKNKMRAAMSHFCDWLMDQGLLDKNPARQVDIPPQPLMAPWVLTDDQRLVLRTLVEKIRNLRSQAIFALGYWSGCRVSDVSWLRICDTHVTVKSGWMRVGHKGGKQRTLTPETTGVFFIKIRLLGPGKCRNEIAGLFLVRKSK
jgi:site-specific recombinase XerD